MDNMHGLNGELVVVTIPPGAQQMIGIVESMSATMMTLNGALIIVPGKGFAKGQSEDMNIMFPQNTIVQQVEADSDLAKEYNGVWQQVRSGIILSSAMPAPKGRM